MADKTIAMFGATGNTGKHFLKAALDQGYTIKALVRNPDKVPVENARLTKVLLVVKHFNSNTAANCQLTLLPTAN